MRIRICMYERRHIPVHWNRVHRVREASLTIRRGSAVGSEAPTTAAAGRKQCGARLPSGKAPDGRGEEEDVGRLGPENAAAVATRAAAAAAWRGGITSTHSDGVARGGEADGDGCGRWGWWSQSTRRRRAICRSVASHGMRSRANRQRVGVVHDLRRCERSC